MANRNKAPVDDMNVDLMAQAELGRLHRQYRIMEGDRLLYSAEARRKLKQQRNILDVMDVEKYELETNITVAKAKAKQEHGKVAAILEKLLTETIKYDEEMKMEKIQISELEVQMRRLEKDVFILKSKNVSEPQAQLMIMDAQRVVYNLENRLSVATVKFNKTVCENQELRQEIDHLLKERIHFNDLYAQLVHRLKSGKKLIGDLIDQATFAYDQREESQMKLHALMERGMQDLKINSQEMRQLQRTMDHDTKLHQFLGVKGQKRIMADLEARQAQKRQEQREAMDQMIKTYQEILRRITEFSGESDIDRLSAKFIKQEEENFALFNYVNELNNELELLQDGVEELHKRINVQREDNRQQADRHNNTLETLQEQIKVAKHRADLDQTQLDACNAVMTKLMKGIEDSFRLVRCDDTPILNLLGDNAHITVFNVMLFLGLLERRTTGLMNLVFYRENKERLKQPMHRRPSTRPPQELLGAGSIVSEGHPQQPRPIKAEKVVVVQPPIPSDTEKSVEDEDAMTIPVECADVRYQQKFRMEHPSVDEGLHDPNYVEPLKLKHIVRMRYV